MTDGSYAGLDDATILERLAGQPQDPPSDSGSGNGDVAAVGGSGGSDDSSLQPGTAGVGSELRARLSALLGRDEYPGELAGWGPIHAHLARHLATLMARGQWRFAITDQHGQLLHCGITAARPTGSARRSASSREIVELQVPVTDLAELASNVDTLGRWAPVVTDLTHQYAISQRPGGPATRDADPTRRAPGAVLRRYLQIRDRRCIMIGCRCPGTRHRRRPHQRLCPRRRHHRMQPRLRLPP